MPSQPPIPPLLSASLSGLPCTSLTLLTSTLGATTSWLIVRFICAASNGREHWASHDVNRSHGHSYDQRVVLVSWLRDEAWWKESGRKLGIDFQKVHVVDGLNSGLGLRGRGIADVERVIMKAIGSTDTLNDGRSVMLVLDGLDFLLAATGCEVLGLLDMIGELKEHVYSTVIASAADQPLSQSPTTPLEISHTAFVMSLAHQARSIMSVRGLDTGAAKDVSGVLRIIKGAGGSADDGVVEERECLYYVGSDGGVKVFERGA